VVVHGAGPWKSRRMMMRVPEVLCQWPSARWDQRSCQIASPGFPEVTHQAGVLEVLHQQQPAAVLWAGTSTLSGGGTYIRPRLELGKYVRPLQGAGLGNQVHLPSHPCSMLPVPALRDAPGGCVCTYAQVLVVAGMQHSGWGSKLCFLYCFSAFPDRSKCL
jgi:hypothetical protein